MVTVGGTGRAGFLEEVAFGLNPWLGHVSFSWKGSCNICPPCMWRARLVPDRPSMGLGHLAVSSCFLVTILSPSAGDPIQSRQSSAHTPVLSLIRVLWSGPISPALHSAEDGRMPKALASSSWAPPRPFNSAPLVPSWDSTAKPAEPGATLPLPATQSRGGL